MIGNGEIIDYEGYKGIVCMYNEVNGKYLIVFSDVLSGFKGWDFSSLNNVEKESIESIGLSAYGNKYWYCEDYRLSVIRQCNCTCNYNVLKGVNIKHNHEIGGSTHYYYCEGCKGSVFVEFERDPRL